MNEDELMDAGQAGKYLGLSRETITRYRQRGVLKACAKRGRIYLFSRSEIEGYASNRREPGNPKWISMRGISKKIEIDSIEG